MDLPRYYVLLALSNEALHGLGVQRQILKDSHGAMYIRDNNIYRLIADLEKRGYVEPWRTEPGLGGKSGTRRLYKLTRMGGRVLRSAAHDLNNFGRLALERLLD
jgi:DNA-binding PadR family transcriptional regulator